MSQQIQIKGIREGLLVKLGDGEWSEIRALLLKQLEQKAEFLEGARLVLDVGNHILKAAEMGSLRDSLADRGLTLWAVLSNSPTTESTAQALGLATRLTKPRPDLIKRKLESAMDAEEAILVRRTLRSGHSLKYPGHVVIIGDVNPGAEIIAAGDVVVWGHLRGMVHAGAEGDNNAVVCALDLSPTQLRIAGEISITPPQETVSHPEIARLIEGQVVAEAWGLKGKS
ncbi:MAG: septum site-determining protein MinC [Anaerolineales bacterium]|jgi:septum site-determining protein MinC